MTPLGVKTYGESEFDIFEAKKCFPGSGKAYNVLKRKVAKMRFWLKTFFRFENFFPISFRWGWPEDVWFHVDKLSSAHVYLRLQPGQTIDNIPEELIEDCCQMVKANSIEVNIVYPPTTTRFTQSVGVCSDVSRNFGRGHTTLVPHFFWNFQKIITEKIAHLCWKNGKSWTILVKKHNGGHGIFEKKISG